MSTINLLKLGMSTARVHYLGIEVDDALAIAEQVYVWCPRGERPLAERRVR